jgi:peptidoglycan hydrolase-like protein with peptidoglycan-binding domain
MRSLALVAAALVAAATLAAGAGARADASVGVFLLYGQDLEEVKRRAGGSLVGRLGEAVSALLVGPNAAERSRRLSSAIPSGVSVLGVSVGTDGGETVATIDLSAGFGKGASSPNVMHARLAQLVYTATQFKSIDAVALEIAGKQPGTIGGIDLDRPLERSDFDAPLVKPSPASGQGHVGPVPADAKAVEERLVALTFLSPDEVDGVFNYATQQAIMAFQAWNGLQRDGIAGPQTLAALQTATAPTPRSTGSGRRVEVYRDLGVVLLVEGSTVTRSVHASTGRPGLETPAGSFKVYSKQRRSWSVPFHEWLEWVAYFDGGDALHAYPDVPAYPASHGCVRLSAPEAPRVFEFVSVGTTVLVY